MEKCEKSEEKKKKKKEEKKKKEKQRNICLGCSKEPSHRDGSFEYPQPMFWLRNKNFVFPA